MARMKWLKCKISRLEMKGMISYKCKGRSARNVSNELDDMFTNNGRKVADLGRIVTDNAPIILPYTVGGESLHPWQCALTPIGNATYTVYRQRLGSTPKRKRQYQGTSFPV